MRRKNGEMVGVCGGEEMKDRGRRKIMDRCVVERKWEREREREMEIHGGGERKSGGVTKL